MSSGDSVVTLRLLFDIEVCPSLDERSKCITGTLHANLDGVSRYYRLHTMTAVPYRLVSQVA
jgi:hypothetical protein